MTADTTVRVDDDLAARQAAVALRAADDEAPRRIDVVLGVLVEQLLGNDRLDHLLQDVLLDHAGSDLGAVLRAHDHRIDPTRTTVDVLDRDLRLAVRAQVVERVVLAHIAQSSAKLMREHDRHRHEFVGLY